MQEYQAVKRRKTGVGTPDKRGKCFAKKKFAHRSQTSGVDLVTLAAMFGHLRTQMVLRYAHPTEEHQFEAMRKVEAYVKTA